MVLELKKRSFLKSNFGFSCFVFGVFLFFLLLFGWLVFCEGLQLPIKPMSRNTPVCCDLSDLEGLKWLQSKSWSLQLQPALCGRTNAIVKPESTSLTLFLVETWAGSYSLCPAATKKSSVIREMTTLTQELTSISWDMSAEKARRIYFTNTYQCFQFLTAFLLSE